MSPTKFMYYSNATVVKQDPKTEELILQLIKPIKPSEAFLGQPGYYEVDDYRQRSHLTARQKEKEQKLEAKRVKEFYAAKGCTEPKLTDPKWYLNTKKENFMEIIDRYKYALFKLLSMDQIREMRKQLKDLPKLKDLKPIAQPVPDRRPRRAAAQTANMMMEIQKEDYGNTSTSVLGGRNMHELVEP